jgi:NitT/TauT family transport system ATP-binding protein
MLARTLIYQPRILAMDEPFGALDSQLRLVMQSELLRLWTETRCTVLFVSHDVGEAIALADRVVVFTGRPGRVAVIEAVDLPRPRYVFRIRFDRRFNEIHDKVWSYLEDSVRFAGTSG